MPERLTSASRERLKQVSTATLTTCLFKRGLRNAFMQNVHLINPAAPRMVGEAFTLRFIPAREDIDVLAAFADPANCQRRAIEECPPGHVLVIDSRKDARAASAGDILMARLMARGVAGAVTDGGFRDTPGIAALDFPVYHQRPSAPTNPIAHHPADLNVPVGCGDVAVYPGDIVVGDREGVVVVPAALADEVAEEAFEMTLYEQFVEDRVHAGRSIAGLYPATDQSRAEYQLWRRQRGQ